MHSAIAQFEPPSLGPDHYHVRSPCVPDPVPETGWRFGQRRHIDHHRIPIAGRSMTVLRLDKIVACSDTLKTNSQVLLGFDMMPLWVVKQQDYWFDTVGPKLPREAQRQ